MLRISLRTSNRIAALALPLVWLAASSLSAQPQSGSQQSSQQSDDPVADAARKAREQKKDQPKPKKVYTNDDIPQAPRSSEPPAAAAPSDAQGAPAQVTSAQDAAAPDAAGKNDEQTWRKRFKAQHEKIARVEKELDILQRESEKAQLQYYADPQKALSEQNTRKDIGEKNAKIAAKKKELDDLKQGLSDLEDALRKAGGDTGWARQ